MDALIVSSNLNPAGTKEKPCNDIHNQHDDIQRTLTCDSSLVDFVNTTSQHHVAKDSKRHAFQSEV